MASGRTRVSSTLVVRQRPFVTDDERWLVVTTRDKTADGHFFYAVRSTGAYCRPSCASRRPLRKNVTFFESAPDAENAGFRPCKRCRPNGLTLAEEQAAAITRACRLIEEAEEVPSLDAISKSVGMSRYHFHRTFKAITGLTPKAYADAHRAERVREALVTGGSVTEAIYDAGFASCGRFYEKASEMLGMQPKHYRSGGRGETIKFAVGECSLGSILVAATNRGVCAILLGSSPDRLVRDLQDHFHAATLIGGDAEFESLVAAVIGFVEKPTEDLGLPLHVRGTAFQHRVWRALRSVPPGTTVSYAEIAKRIGAPRAARAVARACASNVLAVAIPCHRVVRRDGSVSGYRWGVGRKRMLLEAEASSSG